MLEFDVLQSGLVILLLLALGDVLTHFTRGAVPAVLFAGLAYMLCCWAGVLPGDLLESSGLGELPAVVMMMVIVNMGASMDISKFVSNWRVALLAVLVFAGQILALFSVVGGIYGVNTAIGGLPGGMAAALIVQERARALGYEQMFTQMLPPLLLILLTDLAAITLLSALIGRMLGFSPYMGIALGMNIMIGFPLNMLISQDVIYRLVVDERKRSLLMSDIGDRMVICGMISVTFLSTTAASFLVALMK